MYSIPPNPTTHAAPTTPIAIPAFFPLLIPPDEASFDSSVFTLAEDTSLATDSSGAGDKDGGEVVSDEGVGAISDGGGGAGREPVVGDGEGIEGESTEPSCGAGDGEICGGSEETERVKRSVKANK